jgi:hypothetical protein
MIDEQTDMQSWDRKRQKIGKSANGKSAVQETKKLTDEQTDSQQICKC